MDSINYFWALHRGLQVHVRASVSMIMVKDGVHSENNGEKGGGSCIFLFLGYLVLHEFSLFVCCFVIEFTYNTKLELIFVRWILVKYIKLGLE